MKDAMLCFGWEQGRKKSIQEVASIPDFGGRSPEAIAFEIWIEIEGWE